MAKPIAEVGDSEILCAKSYGKEGFYLVTKTAGVSRIVLHALAKGKAVKVLPFDVSYCVLDDVEPIALLTGKGEELHVFKGLDSVFALDGAFSAQIDSNANMLSFYSQIKGEQDNLLLTLVNIKTGKTKAEHWVQKQLLRHAGLHFSENGQSVAISYMDGAGVVFSYDTRSFGVQASFEDQPKLALQVLALKNNWVLNFEGTIQAYDGQTNLWNYSNGDLDIRRMEKSADGKMLLLTNDTRAEFAIIDSKGKDVVNAAYEQLENLKFFPALAQSYTVEAVFNDGFALRDADRKTIRLYNLEQELVRELQMSDEDIVFYSAAMTEPFYVLTRVADKKVIKLL